MSDEIILETIDYESVNNILVEAIKQAMDKIIEQPERSDKAYNILADSIKLAKKYTDEGD